MASQKWASDSPLLDNGQADTIRHDSPGSNLIEATIRPVVSGNREQPQISKSQDFLRYWKLQVLAQIKSWKSPVERRKTALYQNRGIATGHALLHLIPLTSAIALLILNWSQYFIGPSFTLSTTLQFVAKLHELLMQASIGEIILSIVRSQILEGYLPLGALSASTQALHISYLWSLDLLAAATSRSFRGRRKALFVCLVPLLILSTALVGPSSAVLMIPRPGMSSRPIVVHWRPGKTEDSMFPSRLDNKQNLAFDLDRFSTTYTFSKELETQYTTTQIYYNKNDTSIPLISRTLRYALMVKYLPSGRDKLTVRSSTATIPTQLSARRLYQVPIDTDRSRLTWTPSFDYSVSIELPRPVVTAQCVNQDDTRGTTLDTPIAYSRDDGASIGTITSMRELIQQFIDHGGSRNTLISSIPPIWFSSPENGSSSTVGSFIQNSCADLERYVISDLLLEQFNQSLTSSPCFFVRTCTVAAFWEPSQHDLAANDGLWAVHTGLLSKPNDRLPKNTRPILADFYGITGLNTPKFSAMILRDPGGDIPLAAALATVFSEIPWREQMLSAPLNDPYTEIDIALTRRGYGYGTSSISARLSLVVITAYCVFAIGYITYMLSSGHTSTAWNSATELVVLALQSKRTEHLRHVSAGINSIETYRESVGIRVGNRNHLELVFERDQSNESRDLEKIRPNTLY